MKNIVGERIRFLRELIGLKEIELSKKLKIPQPTLNRIENGYGISEENLIKVSNFFNISTDWILKGEEWYKKYIKPIINNIIDKISFKRPPIDLKEIINAYEIQLQYADLGDILGETVKTGTICSISINKSGNEQRDRYTLGHEIGHVFTEYHKGIIFRDTEKTITEEYDLITQKWKLNTYIFEKEANIFASFLLIPDEYFREILNKDFSLKTINEVQEEFDVSKIAGIRRYIELTNKSCAFIKFRGDKREYVKYSSQWWEKYGAIKEFSQIIVTINSMVKNNDKTILLGSFLGIKAKTVEIELLKLMDEYIYCFLNIL